MSVLCEHPYDLMSTYKLIHYPYINLIFSQSDKRKDYPKYT